MSYRGSHPLAPIIDEVVKQKVDSKKWKTDETARKDAIKILEAVIANLGVDKCVSALNEQGFNGDSYRYLISPIYTEAQRRRELFQLHNKNNKKM